MIWKLCYECLDQVFSNLWCVFSVIESSSGDLIDVILKAEDSWFIHYVSEMMNMNFCLTLWTNNKTKSQDIQKLMSAMLLNRLWTGVRPSD